MKESFLLALSAMASATSATPTVMCRTNAQISHSVTGTDPVFGLDAAAVRLGWYVVDDAATPSSARGDVQVFYEVAIGEAAAPASAPPAWTSSKTPSAEMQLVVPAAYLKEGTAYTWKVRVWLKSNPTTPTAWGCGTGGNPAPFETAPPTATFPGSAGWIGGGGQLRLKNGLSVPAGTIAKARAYVTGVGAFYFYINGQRVGINVMDPPQTVYSKTVLYTTFDITSLLNAGAVNDVGALLGNYKWGYTDQWCNMTKAGGPDGCRALLLKIDVTMTAGQTVSASTSNPTDWQVRTGPVVWDHFFHGETYDGSLDLDWKGAAATTTAAAAGGAETGGAAGWSDAVTISPPATAPTGMQVMDSATGKAVALGELKPNLCPPLREIKAYPAISYTATVATDVGSAWIADFGQNMGGMVTLTLPPNHGIPKGTVLRIEHGEVIQGKDIDIDGMCKLCPKCGSCAANPSGGASGVGGGSCDTRGPGAVCDTYCRAAPPAPSPPLPSYMRMVKSDNSKKYPPAGIYMANDNDKTLHHLTHCSMCGHQYCGNDHVIPGAEMDSLTLKGDFTCDLIPPRAAGNSSSGSSHGDVAGLLLGDGDLYSNDLRHEPCKPHQSYTPGFPAGGIPAHDTPDRYIGDFNNANMTNLYTVGGDPAGESYTALFAGAGFRYAQISGLPSSFTPKDGFMAAKMVHSDVKYAAELVLPNMVGTTLGTSDVLQKIHNMTVMSQATNLWSIPTDCPQRERRGWMGDAQASADEANMNFDMQAFYEEFLNKILDDQSRFNGNHPTDTGALADVVPFDGIGGNPGCPVWQVAYIVIARQMWKHYGEDVIPSLTKHFGGLQQLMNWFDRHADSTDGLLVTPCYGDWMGFDPESGNGGGSKLTPPASITAFYHVTAMLHFSEIAGAIGETGVAAQYAAQHAKGQAAYHARFYNATVGGYNPCSSDNPVCHGTSSAGSQTSNSMALALGAPPDQATAYRVAKNMADDVIAFGNRTTSGVVGMAWLFPMLDKYGFSDVALAILLNDAYPSLGHMAHQNMTTLCENLACTFHEAGGGSQNHIMLGGFDAWIMSSIGGLDSVVNGTVGSSGWRNVVARVAPAAITVLKHAAYVKHTRFGPVGISWKYDAGTFSTTLSVPTGVTVAVHTPSQLAGEGGGAAAVLQLQSVEEGGTQLFNNDEASASGGIEAKASRRGRNVGVFQVSVHDNDGGAAAIVTDVGSGVYHFEAKYH